MDDQKTQLIKPSAWISLLCILVSFVGISIFIARRSSGDQTWTDDYFHEHYDARIQTLPRISFTILTEPKHNKLKTVEATTILGEEPFFELQPTLKKADRCATFPNGSTFISQRRGVSEAACGNGFHVFFPSETEAGIMGCSKSNNWAGYICRSDTEDYLMRPGCPTWDATLDCNLREEEPCHPHPIDMGCLEGLQAPVLSFVNETCTHKCPRGYELDSDTKFTPTCSSAGLILPPPPCVKQCTQQIVMPPQSNGFFFECPEAPTTEKIFCDVVPSEWSRVCNKDQVNCEDDLRSIKCPVYKCPADADGLGVHSETPAGATVIPMCPNGMHPIVDKVTCTLNGWSESNICRPYRPPRIRVTRSECHNGFFFKKTSVLDMGFPPMKFGQVSSTQKISCSKTCCSNKGLATSIATSTGGCACELKLYGFTLDKSTRKECCKPPSSWGDFSRYVWRERNQFSIPVFPVSCNSQPCTERECSGSPNGCMGFNVTHLFTRVAAPNSEVSSVGVVENAVILEYIFE